MKAIASACLLVLFAAALPAKAADTDHPDIRAVVESFRTSILQRDKPRFLALFVQAEAPWQSVLSDGSLAQVKRDRPDAMKAKFAPSNNPTQFIDGIVASKNSSEETFDNVRIDTDGDVATVAFDYKFLSNGKTTNWGKECWLLVRTDAGWKITTLVYSVILPKH